MKNKMNSETVVNKTNFITRQLINGMNFVSESIESLNKKIKNKIKSEKEARFDSGYQWACSELKKGNEEMVEAMTFNHFSKTDGDRAFDLGVVQALRDFNGSEDNDWINGNG